MTPGEYFYPVEDCPFEDADMAFSFSVSRLDICQSMNMADRHDSYRVRRRLVACSVCVGWHVLWEEDMPERDFGMVRKDFR